MNTTERNVWEGQFLSSPHFVPTAGDTTNVFPWELDQQFEVFTEDVLPADSLGTSAYALDWDDES